MRTLVFAATLAGAASFVSACSGGTDDAAEPAEQDAAAATTEAAVAAPTAPAIVDANTASEAQLGGIAGITPEIAAAIAAGRPYSDVTALDAKLRQTMSKDAAADVLARIFVPVNLNTASENAIKLIPGMTDKMVHEFLEYRPYADMAEFDREIGKYVDEAEVARLRSYVTL